MTRRKSSCQNHNGVRMDGNKRQIGIMGGTFDPVHNAHLALAKQAYEQYGLDEIWMLPNGNPPHKKDTQQADVEYRMQMIRLAIQKIPYLKLCDLECFGESYHYTYKTLQILHKKYPNTLFYFIMGADSLFEFDGWREPEIISKECVLLAAVRDHCHKEEIQEKIRELKDRYGADIRILNTPNMDIASEDIRGRIQHEECTSYLLPTAVEDYIQKHGLYRTEDK